jgi:hypothetical protein
VIYLDTSVFLAQLLAEDRAPPHQLWQGSLVSSRLLQYEVWNRLHARNLAETRGESATILLGRIVLVELAPTVLSRALAPFPVHLRTLDALHLATIDFLRQRGLLVELASYDERMIAAARAMSIPLAEI